MFTQTRSRQSRARAVVLALAVGGGLSAVGGCAGGGREAREAPQPAREVVRGDWDDVEAAIWTAAGQMEIAVEQIEWGEDVLRATLRTVRSEPVTVVARRLGSAETGRVEVEAQFGRFAESDDRGRRLVELIERRLGQLEGVGAAPAR